MYTYKPERCRLPIKVWAKEGDIEPEALAQIENTACLPFSFHHVALMPDAHQGYGISIGGVVATKNVIIPNAVGVDISCGVATMKTKIKEWDSNIIKEVMGEIRNQIPVGMKGLEHPLFDEMPQKQTDAGIK